MDFPENYQSDNGQRFFYKGRSERAAPERLCESLHFTAPKSKVNLDQLTSTPFIILSCSQKKILKRKEKREDGKV